MDVQVPKQQHVLDSWAEKALLSWSHIISSRTLLTYASLSKQTSPITISPCAHNFPHPSSCIIASCLHAAAGASQWPRYNESLWPSAPGACSAPTPPPATSLLSLLSLHDPHLHGYQSKMAVRTRLHIEHFGDRDSWLWRSRVRVSSNAKQRRQQFED